MVMVGVGNDAGSVKWTCTDGDLDKKYRPSECRATTAANNGG
ncbi:pilin [Kingella kingae]